MATLLSIIEEAVREIGHIAVPSVVVGSTDRAVLRMLFLSNREGRELMRAKTWTVLQTLHTFDTVDSTEEYSLPSDFDRLLPETEWDRTNYRPLLGPLNAEEWEVLKSGLIGSGVVGRRYRIVRSATTTSRTIRIDPTPSSADTLAFWYISKNWCASSGGTTQAAWAADTDVLLLDSDLMVLGTILRIKRAIGLEYASEADEYKQLLERTSAQDRPARVLSLSPSSGNLIGLENLPETGLTG